MSSGGVIIEPKKNIENFAVLIIGGIVLFITICLAVLAVIFSLGGKAPNLFGSNIYLVETDCFGVMNKGTAVISSETLPDNISAGNFVIFENLNNKISIAKIEEISIKESVFTFMGETEAGEDVIISQGQIIGKVNSYSQFLGGLFAFLISPLGVMLLAIIPCLFIAGFEIYKFFKSRTEKSPVATIKKQEEIPTYIPRSKNAVSNAYKRSTYNDDVEDEDENDDEAFFAQPKVSVASPKTYEPPKPATASPLFLGPKQPPRSNVEKPILSHQRLNQAIAQTNAEKENKQVASERTAVINEILKNKSETKPQTPVNKPPVPPARTPSKVPISQTKTTAQPVRTGVIPRSEENVKKFVPRNENIQNKIHQTSSIPRLDQLLKDDHEEENIKFSLDEILGNLDK